MMETLIKRLFCISLSTFSIKMIQSVNVRSKISRIYATFAISISKYAYSNFLKVIIIIVDNTYIVHTHAFKA